MLSKTSPWNKSNEARPNFWLVACHKLVNATRKRWEVCRKCRMALYCHHLFDHWRVWVVSRQEDLQTGWRGLLQPSSRTVRHPGSFQGEIVLEFILAPAVRLRGSWPARTVNPSPALSSLDRGHCSSWFVSYLIKYQTWIAMKLYCLFTVIVIFHANCIIA